MADEDLSMETIMRLAQQLQGAPPPVVNTSAPSNELGLLGRLFGGGGGGLSTEQQEMQARQALMSFGAQMSDAASRPLQYGQRRDFMAGVGEANQAGWGSSAAYAKAARDQMKEDRDERRAQFNDRMSALDAASKIGKMQADLQALRLKREPLDGPGTGTAGAGGGGAGGAAPTGSLQFTGDLEKDRILIKQRESGGDPTALNYVARADPSARAKGATASGLYGFVDSTWREGLQMIGGDAKAYPTAQSAPPEVQDKVFDAIYKARGTAPWDPSKWGKNWAKKADGTYELVATGTSGASSPPPTPPPYKTASTGATPPPTGAPAATPAVPGAPAPAPAPAPAEQPALSEAEARAKAAASGQPVPMLGSDGKPSGLVIKPDGSMSSAPPPTATAPTATAPQQPDDTIGLPPGVPGYRAFREANLRQPNDEDRRLFSGDLTPEDKQSVQSERARLERALQNAQRARQLEGGDASTIVAAQTKLAEHEAKVREAAAAARAKGKEIEAKWWEQQETQLRTAHGKLIEGAETRLTADNAVTNARKTKVLEGVDSDVALTGDRIGSLEALRVLSKQVGSGTLIGDIQVGGRSLADIITATGWGGPELGKKAADVQQFQAAVNAAIKDIKSGVAMGAVSDRDLIFLENMVANPRQDERTRNLIITGLIAAQERKRDVAVLIGNLVGSGVAPHQAIAQAHKEVPPIFRQVPPEIDKGPSDRRGDWFRDNVRPGQLYRRGDNTVDVYPGPNGAQ